MQVDYRLVASALKEECDLMLALTAALERERAALGCSDLSAMAESAGAKETLVSRLDAARARRKAAMAVSTEKGLRSLAKAAPAAWAEPLRALQRRAADLAERVFLLNRGNGQILTQGRDFLRQRMDSLRYRGGRVVLYGRQYGYVSIGGAAIVQRDL